MEIATDPKTLAQWLREMPEHPIRLALYHLGCQDEPVDFLDILEGIPDYPWRCPICHQNVTETEARYDFVRFPLDNAAEIGYNESDAE